MVGGLLGLLWAGAALLIGCWDVYQRETMSFPFNWVAPPTHGSPYHPALVTIWAAAGVAGLLGAVVVARRPRSAAILAAVAVVVGFVAAATVGDIWYGSITPARAALAWLIPVCMLGGGAFAALHRRRPADGSQPSKGCLKTS